MDLGVNGGLSRDLVHQKDIVTSIYRISLLVQTLIEGLEAWEDNADLNILTSDIEKMY